MESILEAFANDNLEVLPSTCPKSAVSGHLLNKADKLTETLEAGKPLSESVPDELCGGFFLRIPSGGKAPMRNIHKRIIVWLAWM